MTHFLKKPFDSKQVPRWSWQEWVPYFRKFCVLLMRIVIMLLHTSKILACPIVLPRFDDFSTYNSILLRQLEVGSLANPKMIQFLGLQVDMMLQVMPKIAAEVSAPLCHTNKITMISDGNGEFGASRLTDEVLTIMKTIPQVTMSAITTKLWT